MKNRAILSIIIPTKNREKYLKQAIDSILDQDEKNIEIIIIDDNSTDNTKKIVQDYNKRYEKIIYLKNDKNLFANESRKKGYDYATGKYIIFMDDDDFYIDNTFFSQSISLLEKNNNINTVIGSTITFENNKFLRMTDLQFDGFVKNNQYLNDFGKKYPKPLSTLTAIFRKESLDEVGLSKCEMINDTCIYLYGILEGDIYVINKPVAAYRIHQDNISKKKFSPDFVKKCLKEKRKIYKIAKKDNKLINSKEWYFNQMLPTLYYFIYSSNKDFYTIVTIFLWMLLYGNEIRIKFFWKIMCDIKSKKGSVKI